MSSYLFVVIGAVLVNNVVFVRILGLCPFMGVSNRLDAAYGMAMVTGLVLTLSAALSWKALARLARAGLAACPPRWNSPMPASAALPARPGSRWRR